MGKQCNTVVSLDETITAMGELTHGTYPASFLSALRNSALSLRVQLISNCGYAIVLRKYRDVPLPTREVLEGELKTAIRQDGSGKLAWGIMEKHLDTLYVIDALYFSGQIPLDYGTTLESQRAWREKLVHLIPGMGWKLISWALFIYDPLNCHLLTIDCIHCKRLGLQQNSLSGNNERQQQEYERVELLVQAECLGIAPLVHPVVTAAMLWLNARRQGVTSHQGISCRY